MAAQLQDLFEAVLRDVPPPTPAPDLDRLSVAPVSPAKAAKPGARSSSERRTTARPTPADPGSVPGPHDQMDQLGALLRTGLDEITGRLDAIEEGVAAAHAATVATVVQRIEELLGSTAAQVIQSHDDRFRSLEAEITTLKKRRFRF